mmetsp:Transcript_2570/g.3931  ORF Transcript_2570/g.3931 Transcript_2570/m.3931 type:complete len:236 (+) Transcript_2570:555-1262(+)
MCQSLGRGHSACVVVLLALKVRRPRMVADQRLDDKLVVVMVGVHEILQLFGGTDCVNSLAGVAVRDFHDSKAAHRLHPNGDLTLVDVTDGHRRADSDTCVEVLVVEEFVRLVGAHFVASAGQAAHDGVENERLLQHRRNASPRFLCHVAVGRTNIDPGAVGLAHLQLTIDDSARWIGVGVLPCGEVHRLACDVCHRSGVPAGLHVILVINNGESSFTAESLHSGPESPLDELVVV